MFDMNDGVLLTELLFGLKHNLIITTKAACGTSSLQQYMCATTESLFLANAT